MREEHDVEARREVRLTGFTNALDDALRNTEDTANNNPNPMTNLENRLNTSAVSQKVDKAPDNSKQDFFCSSGTRWLTRKIKGSFKKKILHKRIPIVYWLPRYSKEYAVSDMVAGLTVGLTVIPQAIAYANVAGLPPQYGLYSSFMACFVYTVLGSCKDVPVGPTAIAAILTRETLTQKAHLGPGFVLLLTFISGCVSMLMGILQLGDVIDPSSCN